MTALIVSAVAVALLMLAAWVASRHLRDVSIVDVVWGPAFVLVAWISAFTAGGDGGRRVLAALLTTVWGVRLALHVGQRKLHDRTEDRRYAAMRERRPRFEVRSLYLVFGLQGLLVLVVGLPLLFPRDHRLDALALLGAVLWLAGLVFEAVGDAQLEEFKGNPDHRGKVMDRGLWRYTRHPNYFGDACVWWGLWIAGGRWWTFAGPLVMTVLLVRVSGKALLERDIADRRPGYAEYVRRTSGFIPLPPRR